MNNTKKSIAEIKKKKTYCNSMHRIGRGTLAKTTQALEFYVTYTFIGYG